MRSANTVAFRAVNVGFNVRRSDGEWESYYASPYDPDNPCYARYWCITGEGFGNGLVLNPQETVYLVRVDLDHCDVPFPPPDPATVGDSVWAGIVFAEGQTRDTLIVLGTFSYGEPYVPPVSSSTPPGGQMPAPHRAESPAFYDTQGRQLPGASKPGNDRSPGVYLNPAAGNASGRQLITPTEQKHR